MEEEPSEWDREEGGEVRGTECRRIQDLIRLERRPKHAHASHFSRQAAATLAHFTPHTLSRPLAGPQLPDRRLRLQLLLSRRSRTLSQVLNFCRHARRRTCRVLIFAARLLHTITRLDPRRFIPHAVPAHFEAHAAVSAVQHAVMAR
ncbi:hypothetical protein L1887_60158 [Cichorium endivia]|nr:hypothetical protein L1887_60158 [Cichorium endivia]